MKIFLTRAVLPAALGLCLAGLAGTPALAADPPAAAPSPVGGTDAHPHSVVTGSGCVDINQVLFERAERGLHRAAFETGTDKGPWHGACPIL